MISVNKILCPIDWSQPSIQALNLASDLAAHFGAELCVLHVVEPLRPSNASGAPGEFERNASGEVARTIATLMSNCPVQPRQWKPLVRFGDPAHEIVSAATAEKATLIVMSRHGHTGWHQSAYGSVTEQTVRTAPCPVLTLGLPGVSSSRPFANQDTAATQGATALQAVPCIAVSSVVPEEDSVPESEFPFAGSEAAQLRFLLRYAIQAPSNRNAQPWLWRFKDHALELLPDERRTLPVVDPEGRETVIACGAALHHLRVALRHFGCAGQIEIIPGEADCGVLESDLPHPDFIRSDFLTGDSLEAQILARVRRGEAYTATPTDELLFAAIERRHTTRELFQERAIADEIIEALRSAAAQEGAWLYLIQDNDKRLAVIHLIGTSDRYQGGSQAFLRETHNWLHPDDPLRHEGIPHSAMGKGGLLSHYTIALGTAQADKNRMLAWNAPVLAVLGTDEDSRCAWLSAGQALSAVLLHASAAKIEAGFFNSPLEMADSRQKLSHLTRQYGYPQMLLRLGYAAPGYAPTATPRRSVSEVLLKSSG